MDRHRFPWRMAVLLVAGLVSLLAIAVELAGENNLLIVLLWTVVGVCSTGLAMLEAVRLRHEPAPAEPARHDDRPAADPVLTGGYDRLLLPEQWESAREQAARLARQGRTAEAIDLLRRLTDLNDLAAFLPLARLLDDAGATQDAVRYYRVAAGSQDDDGEAAFQYGTALARLDRVEEAIAWLGTAVDRGHRAAANNLGSMLHRAGETEAARQLYLFGLAQGDPVATTNLARDLLDDGNTAAAKKYLQIAVDGGDPDGSLMLGQLLEDEGDHLAAVACYREASTAHPAALIVAAGALWKAGRPDEANELLAVAAGHDDRQVAFEALSILVLARTDEGNHDAATIWLRRAAAVCTPEQLEKLRQDATSNAARAADSAPPGRS